MAAIQIDKTEEVVIHGASLELLPQKAIYWQAEQCLLLADLHLGKGSHFRKNGIPVPPASSKKNWFRLHQLFRIEELKKVIFLGDLFHSEYNQECKVFEELVELYPHISFELVRGNHDILSTEEYTKMGFKIHQNPLLMSPFILSHEPMNNPEKYYNLAGHIHPAVKLRGKGKQSHKVACFHFGPKQGILPAFGNFTGFSNVQSRENDQVFVILDEQIFKIQ